MGIIAVHARWPFHASPGIDGTGVALAGFALNLAPVALPPCWHHRQPAAPAGQHATGDRWPTPVLAKPDVPRAGSHPARVRTLAAPLGGISRLAALPRLGQPFPDRPGRTRCARSSAWPTSITASGCDAGCEAGANGRQPMPSKRSSIAITIASSRPWLAG
jgi:hypothetical protein